MTKKQLTNGQPDGKFGADGDVIYIAFLARLETGANTSFGGFSLFDDSFEQLFIGDTFGGVNWGISGGLSAAPIDGSTRLLVARIDFAAGAETIRFYVDPPLAGEPASARSRGVAGRDALRLGRARP